MTFIFVITKWQQPTGKPAPLEGAEWMQMHGTEKHKTHNISVDPEIKKQGMTFSFQWKHVRVLRSIAEF